MSFESFYRQEFASMVALARAVCTDPSLAEDIAQEALARAHERWSTISTYDKPGAWLRRWRRLPLIARLMVTRRSHAPGLS